MQLQAIKVPQAVSGVQEGARCSVLPRAAPRAAAAVVSVSMGCTRGRPVCSTSVASRCVYMRVGNGGIAVEARGGGGLSTLPESLRCFFFVSPFPSCRPGRPPLLIPHFARVVAPFFLPFFPCLLPYSFGPMVLVVVLVLSSSFWRPSPLLSFPFWLWVRT